jgi:hypothetical protein
VQFQVHIWLTIEAVVLSSTTLIDRLFPVESRLDGDKSAIMTFRIILMSVPSQKSSLLRPLFILLGRADQAFGVKQGINIFLSLIALELFRKI